ncbi:MAG: HAD family phosphatase [Myxococcales bacterium]|nr:HAD family phosphatase [Myxococcales bacterium]
MKRRLLALDLDGTLLLRSGGVHARDVAAIARARKAGFHVTLATGRLTTGTLPTARLLDLDDPMVCGDGATIADPRTGVPIERRAVSPASTDAIVQQLLRHGLVPFVFVHGAIHGDARGRHHHDAVRIWTEDVHWHADVEATDAWRGEGEVAMTLGLGSHEATASARAHLHEHHGALEHDRFDFGGASMLRSLQKHTSKGAALARVAERLGVAREDTAAVGDWVNDLSMFRWVGRSFAMGGAPPEVASVATDQLGAPAGQGGGVAEAIDRLLA